MVPISSISTALAPSAFRLASHHWSTVEAVVLLCVQLKSLMAQPVSPENQGLVRCRPIAQWLASFQGASSYTWMSYTSTGYRLTHHAWLKYCCVLALNS